MEPWEDELLLDDDFSEEEEDAEEQIEKTSLEMDADGFADWEDASDGAPEDETLEEALAEERTLELESELIKHRDPERCQNREHCFHCVKDWLKEKNTIMVRADQWEL